ncbi:hypothetical protein D3C86_2248920 [compost metagenome]
MQGLGVLQQLIPPELRQCVLEFQHACLKSANIGIVILPVALKMQNVGSSRELRGE